MIYQNAAVSVYGTVVLVGLVDRSLFCTSPDLITSFNQRVTPLCAISGYDCFSLTFSTNNLVPSSYIATSDNNFTLYRWTIDLRCSAIGHVGHHSDSIHTSWCRLSIPCKKVSVIGVETQNTACLFPVARFNNSPANCYSAPSKGLFSLWHNVSASCLHFSEKRHYGVYVDDPSQHSAVCDCNHAYSDLLQGYQGMINALDSLVPRPSKAWGRSYAVDQI